jgi:hypothetical protein
MIAFAARMGKQEEVMRKVAAVLVAALACTACGSEPVGNWQSREKLSNDKRNTMFLDADETGELKLYAVLAAGEGLTKLNYDLSYVFEGVTEDDFDQFELKLKCDKGCRDGIDLDFEMDCILDDSFDLLDCVAKSPFKGYGFFEWERLPE